jgi:hypothetical protein
VTHDASANTEEKTRYAFGLNAAPERRAKLNFTRSRLQASTRNGSASVALKGLFSMAW